MTENEEHSNFLQVRGVCRERIELPWRDYRKNRPSRVRRLAEELGEIPRQSAPWVGKDYCDCEGRAPSAFGARVLVVGDSTYRSPLTEEEFAREFAEDREDWFNKEVFQYKSGCWRAAYWTMWTDALVSSSVGEKDEDRQPYRRNVLDNLAFYNFCDCILGAARARPEEEYFAKGAEQFPEILRILGPDLVILTAFRVRDALFARNQYKVDELERYSFVRVPRASGHSALLCLPHPTYRKGWKRPQVRAAVEKALRSVGGHLLCPGSSPDSAT